MWQRQVLEPDDLPSGKKGTGVEAVEDVLCPHGLAGKKIKIRVAFSVRKKKGKEPSDQGGGEEAVAEKDIDREERTPFSQGYGVYSSLHDLQ